LIKSKSKIDSGGNSYYLNLFSIGGIKKLVKKDSSFYKIYLPSMLVGWGVLSFGLTFPDNV
jgi:hypothetical protein